MGAISHGWAPIFGILLCTCLSGCAVPRYLRPRTFRENALDSSLKLMRWRGPEISPRTQATLARYGLEHDYNTESERCLTTIRGLATTSASPELAYALAELSYVEGKKADRAGRTSDALNHYGMSLTTSYQYLFGPQLREVRNEFDPQFRAVCDLYNESLEDTLRVLCAENRLRPGQTYTIQTADRQFVIRTEMRGGWKPDEFDHYEFCSDYEIKTLRNRHTTFGLGVPLIAVRKRNEGDPVREKYYPDGLSYATTAMMRCSADATQPVPVGGSMVRSVGYEESVTDVDGKARLASGPRGDASDVELRSPVPMTQAPTTPVCVLEFFDPLRANQIHLADQWVPLETDLTTPLAFFLDSPEYRKRDTATEGLLEPDDVQSRRGLYMLEPYDPNRIPVLMVHGLWSSPLTWMDMFNDLRSFPEIRERYQFWFYLYPSGQPFWSSATQLRGDLFEMRKTFDPAARDAPLDQMVLVGHSMGGLISRMQTIDSGDDFWNLVSNQPRENLKGPPEAVNKLVSALEFHPNQSIRRVITIGTPHRGSELASPLTRWLARHIIELPRMAVSTGKQLARDNPGFFRDTRLLTEATAIDSLTPESPIFPVMMKAKRSPHVKYHSIIGVLKDPPLFAGRGYKGDGVVEYASASVDDVESELVVDAKHSEIQTTGKATFEVREILLQHLKEIDTEDRLAFRDRNRRPLAWDRTENDALIDPERDEPRVRTVGMIDAAVVQPRPETNNPIPPRSRYRVVSQQATQ
ncbi:MAG: hypothetical protein AAGD07_11320 [Planctomycetota bacterium]